MTALMIQHSVGEDAPELKTMQLRYWRGIHAELMTHRDFSRNARSSRAVPVPRLIEEVATNPFVPRHWGANQRGMQAGAECSSNLLLHYTQPELREIGGGEPARTIPARLGVRELGREEGWLHARDRAVEAAWAFHNAGYHKQIVNRLLEPFMFIDVLVTATQWSNFYALRDDAAAEPHFRDLAREMLEADQASTPTLLRTGDWHLPYVSPEDGPGTRAFLEANPDWGQRKLPYSQHQQVARAVSVTRCARISYVPFHGESGSIAAEVERHDALIAARPIHASPLEHQATPDLQFRGRWMNPERHGNLVGWQQYRKFIPGEHQ